VRQKQEDGMAAKTTTIILLSGDMDKVFAAFTWPRRRRAPNATISAPSGSEAAQRTQPHRQRIHGPDGGLLNRGGLERLGLPSSTSADGPLDVRR
jgi:hypothetical protein